MTSGERSIAAGRVPLPKLCGKSTLARLAVGCFAAANDGATNVEDCTAVAEPGRLDHVGMEREEQNGRDGQLPSRFRPDDLLGSKGRCQPLDHHLDQLVSIPDSVMCVEKPVAVAGQPGCIAVAGQQPAAKSCCSIQHPDPVACASETVVIDLRPVAGDGQAVDDLGRFHSVSSNRAIRAARGASDDTKQCSCNVWAPSPSQPSPSSVGVPMAAVKLPSDPPPVIAASGRSKPSSAARLTAWS